MVPDPPPAPTTPEPPSAQAHLSNAQSVAQAAIAFAEALLSGDNAKIQQAVKSTEGHVVSVVLDFVPPTYRGLAQGVADNLINATSSPDAAKFIGKEAGIGFAFARARISAFIAGFKL